MIPTTKEIVWHIAALHEMYPKETISELANRLMMSPILIINALEEGESMEFFVRKRDKKGNLTEELETVSPIDWGNMAGNEFGSEIVRFQNEILRAIASANSEKNDIEDGTLQAWCRGVKPCAIELALRYLQEQNIISNYQMADPSDKKSVYTFHTLKVNESEKWGSKQFKKGKK